MDQRPLVQADLPELLGTLNAREHVDGLPIRTPEADLEEALTAPGLDLGRDSVGIFAPDGGCVAYGFVWCPAEPTPQFHPARLHLVVHPVRAGQGKGRLLLANLVARGRQLLDRVESPSRWITAVIEQRQTAARTLLSRTGFSVMRYFNELVVPLDEASAVDARAGLSGDLRVIGWDPLRSREAKGVMRGAFADHWGSTPVSEPRWQAMTSPPRFQPDLSTMAVRADPAGDPDREAVVGIVVVHLWPEDWPVTGRRSVDIDVVAVSRGARRKGVAGAMIARTLDRSRRRDLTHATLGVDTESPSDANRLYGRLGFRPLTRHQVWGLDVTADQEGSRSHRTMTS